MNRRVQLKVLGALDVGGIDAAAAADVLGRPKPLALLIYLVLHQSREFHQNDALLALFWPDADLKRAQISLRQTVHVLRRTLGDEVVSRRGRNELGIPADSVQCDAIEFEVAVREGRLEKALALYSGELLPAFHVHDTVEFEHWLSGERSRLQTLALECCETLLANSLQLGDSVAAARWTARARTLGSSSHAGLGTTQSVKVQPPEMPGPFHAIEPAANAVSTTGELLASAHFSARINQNVVDAPAIRVAADPIGVATAPTFSVDPAAPRRVFKSRRIRMLGAIGIAASVVVVAGIGAIGRGAMHKLYGGTAADQNAPRIAILPFTVMGSERVMYLREGMADLLSARLDGAGGIRVVDPAALLAYGRTTPATDDAGDAALLAARKFSAAQYVVGNIIEAGDHIAATATLYDSSGARLAMVDGSAETEEQLLPLVDNLARGLLAARYSSAPLHLERTAAITTNSLPALKAFLEGETAVRQGYFPAAVDAFTRAVRADSTFALAHYRLSTAANWSTQPALVERSVDLAMKYADRLPQHERLALQARSLVRNGAADEADRLYRDIVARYPEDVDAWTQLGELIFHTGPWRGRPLAESRFAFEKTVSLQPGNVNAILHLVRLATLENRPRDVSALTARAFALHPEHEIEVELRALQASLSISAVHGDGTAPGRADAVTGIGNDERLVAWRVATYSDDPSEALAIAAGLADARNSVHMQVLGHALRAHMKAASGEWRAAQLELDWIEARDPDFAAETRANLSLSSPASLSPAVRARTMQVLMAALGNQMGTPADSNSADTTRIARRSYLLGTLAVAGGDTALAQSQQRALAILGRKTAVESELARHLAHQLSARILARHGDIAAALHEVEIGWPAGTARAALPLFQGDVYTQAHERYFRGELLMALGRDEEALRWLGCVTDDQGASLVLSAPVHLARARIAERRGDASMAVDQYRRAARLWSSSDVPLRRDVGDALKELEVLRLNRASYP